MRLQIKVMLTNRSEEQIVTRHFIQTSQVQQEACSRFTSLPAKSELSQNGLSLFHSRPRLSYYRVSRVRTRLILEPNSPFAKLISASACLT
jgi:hypothetical protein